jgi:regulator of sirC expression with transglutaminase-like and TPR domain
MDPTERFAALMADPSASPPLDEAAFLIAAAQRRHFDLIGQLARLDEMAASTPSPTVEGLVRRLFWGETALRGNEADYYDPENSLLDAVLDRQVGLPITLSVVVIEVGRRLGLRFGGVGMPAHFLVRALDPPHDGGPEFLDAFGGGRRLTADGCRALYQTVSGGVEEWDDAWLEPVDHRSIVIRMLNNLKAAYARRADLGGLLRVMRLRMAVPELAAVESDEHRRLLARLN